MIDKTLQKIKAETLKIEDLEKKMGEISIERDKHINEKQRLAKSLIPYSDIQVGDTVLVKGIIFESTGLLSGKCKPAWGIVGKVIPHPRPDSNKNKLTFTYHVMKIKADGSMSSHYLGGEFKGKFVDREQIDDIKKKDC